MSEQIQLAPTELHDHGDPAWPVIAIRADTMSRGQARAFWAQELGCDFTAVKVSLSAYHLDTGYIADAEADGVEEPYDGWPWIECSDGTAYWKLEAPLL